MRASIKFVPAVVILILSSCSKPAATKEAKQIPLESGPATTTSKHPLAKYVEFSGFRLSEAGPGMLRVKLIAVNHSEADFSELTVKISLTTSVAKPGDPPVLQFDVKVPPLGPQEIKDITVTIPSKVRMYEIPDWQFLRAQFDITAPAP
jgi:hypothetical protein